MIMAIFGVLWHMSELYAKRINFIFNKFNENLMENTNCGENCPFVVNGTCKTDLHCCNYIESWWTEKEGGKPKLVKDCAPKRTLLMQQDQANYTLNLQQNIDSLKKEVNNLNQMLTSIIMQSIEYQKSLKSDLNEQVEHKI